MTKMEKETKFVCLAIGVLGVCCILFSLYGCGTNVIQGPPGKPGATGPTGSSGMNGQNCTVSTVQPSDAAPNGGSLIQCPDGSQSLVLNGTNGTDGTEVTFVQFCSGVTPTYGSVYAEGAFCIQGNLYAVYSSTATLVEVTPGAYGSISPGANCSFTVGPNCQVSN